MATLTLIISFDSCLPYNSSQDHNPSSNHVELFVSYQPLIKIMFLTLCFFYFLGFLLLDGSFSDNDGEFGCSAAGVLNVGVIADNNSRVGREQIIAIHMAAKDFPFSSSCGKVKLLLVDSPENSPQATASGEIHHLLSLPAGQ